MSSPSLPFRLILLLGALTAFGPLSIDMYLPAFARIRAELPSQFATVEMTLAAFLFSMAVSQLLYGPLSDRFGRRKPLIFGCALFFFASIGCAMARTMEELVVARMLQGFGGAAGVVIARACVRDQLDERASARIFSQLILVMGVAPILAPWIGGQMLRIGEWHWIFVFMGGFSLLVGGALWKILPETLPPDRRSKAGFSHVMKNFAILLKDRFFLGSVLAGGFNSGVLFAYIAGSPFVYIELFGVSETAFTYYFGLNALGVIGVAQVNQWLLNVYSPKRLLSCALFGAALFGSIFLVAVIFKFATFPLMVVLLFLCLSSVGIAFPNATALALSSNAERAGSASAILGTCQFLIGSLAGFAVGFLRDGTAWPIAIVLATCGIAGFTILRILTRPR